MYFLLLNCISEKNVELPKYILTKCNLFLNFSPTLWLFPSSGMNYNWKLFFTKFLPKKIFTSLIFRKFRNSWMFERSLGYFGSLRMNRRGWRLTENAFPVSSRMWTGWLIGNESFDPAVRETSLQICFIKIKNLACLRLQNNHLSGHFPL